MNETPIVNVIDNDPAVRDSLVALLRTMGVEVKPFESAEEFLPAYDSSQHGCVVTDLRLSGMSGLEILDRLSQQPAGAPVILLTAYADVRTAVRSMRRGAIAFLEKPFNDQELWDAVSEALVRDRERRALVKRRADIEARIAALTDGERQVLSMLLAGKANKVMANELGVSERTIESRRQKLFKKLNASSLAELIRVSLDVMSPHFVNRKRLQ